MKEKGKRLDIIIGSYKRIERIHKKADFIKNTLVNFALIWPRYFELLDLSNIFWCNEECPAAIGK